jgi:hypothetical protein
MQPRLAQRPPSWKGEGMTVTTSAAGGRQRALALAHANEIRLVRAALKRKIAAGTIRPSELLLSCPSEIETMSVFQLLRSQRRWGPARCTTVLRDVELSEGKTIGSLTERQRGLLVAALGKLESAPLLPHAAWPVNPLVGG